MTTDPHQDPFFQKIPTASQRSLLLHRFRMFSQEIPEVHSGKFNGKWFIEEGCMHTEAGQCAFQTADTSGDMLGHEFGQIIG